MSKRMAGLLGGLMGAVSGLVVVSAHGAAPSLGEALDATNLVWTTGGATPWYGETTNTYYLADAAQSGALLDGQTNWIQTTVTGPGLLSFAWTVSSEPGFDFLRFYINGVKKAEISGVPGSWTEIKDVPVPVGSQNLRWAYEKDVLGYLGMDAGWVDKVEFTATSPQAPAILGQPQNQTVFAGQRAVFALMVTGSEPLSYRWQVYSNGSFTTIGSNAALVLPDVRTNAAGTYRAIVTNAYGGATSSNASLTVLSPLPLAPCLDGPGLTWTTGGAKPWIGETNLTHDLADAVQSGFLTDNQTNWIETTVTGPGTIAFWWKVSSEPDFDFLVFSVGGFEKGRVSGETDWQYRLFTVPPGSQRLRWSYSKDTVNAMGADAGWVDQVAYVTNGVLPAPTIIKSGTNAPAFIDRGVFRFAFSTQPGMTYFVEYKDNLTPAAWTSLTNLLGTGSTAIVYDLFAFGHSRFYRTRSP